MSSIGVTLYHADWCGHCVKFQPEWKKFELVAKDLGYKTEIYEHAELKGKDVKIGGKSLRGYPSIKISVGGSNEFEYTGKRYANELVSFLDDLKANKIKK